MSTETAVTRLDAAIDTHDDAAHTVVFALEDAKGLLDIIADLCDDHARCSHCGTALCTTCGLGQTAGCSDRQTFEDHCVDCAGDCQVCRREVHESYEADLAMDGRHS